MKLPVDVTADGHRAGDRMYGGLLQHELLNVFAQVLEVELWQQLAFADGLDPLVEHGARYSRAPATVLRAAPGLALGAGW